jgi:hypothetical protein
MGPPWDLGTFRDELRAVIAALRAHGIWAGTWPRIDLVDRRLDYSNTTPGVLPEGIELPDDDPKWLYVMLGWSVEQVSRWGDKRKGWSVAQLERRASAERWRELRGKYEAEHEEKLRKKLSETAAQQSARHVGIYKDVQSLARFMLADVTRDVKRAHDRKLPVDPRDALNLRRITMTLNASLAGERALREGTEDPFKQLLDRAGAVGAKQEARKVETRKQMGIVDTPGELHAAKRRMPPP